MGTPRAFAPGRTWHDFADAPGRDVDHRERSLLDILAAIDRSRFHTTCFLPECHTSYRIAVEDLCDDVISFPYRWRSVVPCAPADFVRFVDEFQRARVDLVHVNTVTLVAPLLAARRLNVPSILHARECLDVDQELATTLGGDPQNILHTLKAQADFIIVNSDATHRLFQMHGKCIRLYNCVDLQALDCSNDLQPGRLRAGVLSATNAPRKGIEQFVALAIAASRCPELEFLVIGPRTPYTEALERVASGQPGPVRIQFNDYCANSVDALRQVNVVMSVPVIPESFGRTIAEGMAMRRPIISYDTGAAPELIRHGQDGFLIPYGEIMHALEHLEALARAPERVMEMGARGRGRALQLFCPRKFAEDLNGLYDRVLGQGDVLSLH